VTPEKIRQAAALVRRGDVLSLSIPLDLDGPQDPRMPSGGGRSNPLLMVGYVGPYSPDGHGGALHGGGWADDVATFFLQGATHWDGLGHVADRGRLYNGFGPEHLGKRGVSRDGVEHWKAKIVTRGVLLDVARSKEVDHLAPGYPITEADLLACIERQGPTSAVGRGDIVLLRTGHLAHARANGWAEYTGGDAPGLSFHTAPFLHRTEMAGIASDTWGLEVFPHEMEGASGPLHQVLIPNMGLLVGEIFDLEELAYRCAADGVFEFMLVASPLVFSGAVSGATNPQAIR
jgi:kynurenine formamidase